MQSAVYNTTGKEVSQVTLPDEVFGLHWNGDLVSQVVHSMTSNARDVIAHTKDRGDVSGGGKKPWKQKGTGRARHGSSRSPLWVGGGVAHGPRNEKNYNRKINKKMKAKALYTVLSKKLSDGEIIFVDALTFNTPKTKDAKAVVEALSGAHEAYKALATRRKNAAVIAISDKNEATEKSFANFSNMDVLEVRNMNVLDVLNSKYIIIENPDKALEFFMSKKLFKNKTTA